MYRGFVHRGCKLFLSVPCTLQYYPFALRVNVAIH